MTRKGKRTGKDLLAKWLKKKPRQDLSSHGTDLDLPSELWARILTPDNFSVSEFVGLRHVCKKWRDVVDHVGTIEHEIKCTFQDDLSDLAPADRERPVPLAIATLKFRGMFPVAHLRALQSQWNDAKSAAEREATAIGADGEAKLRHLSHTSCQLLCDSLQWDCVEGLTIDLSGYEKLVLTVYPMESQASTYRLPDILKSGIKRARSLRSLALVDVHHVFFDADTVLDLSSKVDKLEVKTVTDISQEMFFEHEHCKTLVKSVSALAVESCYSTSSVEHFLFNVFDATWETVQELSIRIDYFGDEEDEQASHQDDAAEDPGIAFEMVHLREFTMWMDTYHEVKLSFAVDTPKLEKANVTPQAMEYLTWSAPWLLGESLRQLEIQIGTYTFIDDALEQNIWACTSLTTLLIHVEDFDADGDFFGMSFFLDTIARNPQVPLQKLVVSGAHKWDGLGLLELVSSRYATREGGQAVAPRRIDTVIAPGLEIPRCTRNALDLLIPKFLCAPIEPEKEKGKLEPSAKQDTSTPQEGVVDPAFVHNFAYSS